MTSRLSDHLRDELLTAADLAALFRVNKRTIFRKVARGELPPPIRIGHGVVRWKKRDLLALLGEPSEG